MKALQQLLDSFTAWRIPGLDCAVAHQGKVIFRHTSGYSDLEAQIPMDRSLIYYLYSSSKVITVVAALMLVEEGKLCLEDPLSLYFPEYKSVKVRANDSLHVAQNPIRIKDLFCMTSGFNYNLDSPSIRQVREATDGRCPTEAIARALANEPLDFEPGTHWQYSLSHDVLAAVVERVADERFGAYLKRRIFDPCGMRHTGFELHETDGFRFTPQYQFDTLQNRALRTDDQNAFILGTAYESGGAGLYSTVDDVLNFQIALCHGQLLQPETLDLMRRDHLSDAVRPDFNWPHFEGYSYGLGVRTLVEHVKGSPYESLSPLGEFGWGGAAGTYILMDLDHDLQIFYAQHLLNSQEEVVHHQIRNTLYRELQLG